MKRLILSAFIVLVSVLPAAADGPWSGFYGGLNGGFGSSSNCWTNLFLGFIKINDGCQTANGEMLGGQLGYRWQSQDWVFGVEAQADWANLDGTANSVLAPAFKNETKIDAIGLLTAQFGRVITDDTLLYAKGGLAVTDNHYNSYSNAPPFALAGSASDTRVGGAVGIGIEHAFAARWTAGIEYDHLFMPDNQINQKSTVPAFPLFATIIDRQGVDMVTLRVNYKF